MNLDLRNSASDGSQRMLNAIEPGSPLPIHRHMKSSETVVCLRGHLREVFYDADGRVIDTIDLIPGGPVVGLCIPIGQWHTVEVLESGTVIMEVKDGAYEPLGTEDVMELQGVVGSWVLWDGGWADRLWWDIDKNQHRPIKRIIDQKILDELTASAKSSPRLRMNLDFRNRPEDGSQRMLNALEPGRVMAIHRHRHSSETVVILRGRICWHFFDEEGKETERVVLDADGEPRMLNVEKDRWHSLVCLESGSVLFECKDGAYAPLGEEEVIIKKHCCL